MNDTRVIPMNDNPMLAIINARVQRFVEAMDFCMMIRSAAVLDGEPEPTMSSVDVVIDGSKTDEFRPHFEFTINMKFKDQPTAATARDRVNEAFKELDRQIGEKTIELAQKPDVEITHEACATEAMLSVYVRKTLVK